MSWSDPAARPAVSRVRSCFLPVNYSCLDNQMPLRLSSDSIFSCSIFTRYSFCTEPILKIINWIERINCCGYKYYKISGGNICLPGLGFKFRVKEPKGTTSLLPRNCILSHSPRYCPGTQLTQSLSLRGTGSCRKVIEGTTVFRRQILAKGGELLSL